MMIYLLGGSEEELQQLTERLEKTVAGRGMEKAATRAESWSTAKAKAIYQHNGEEVREEVDHRLGLNILDPSKLAYRHKVINEEKIRLTQAHSATIGLSVLWRIKPNCFPT